MKKKKKKKKNEASDREKGILAMLTITFILLFAQYFMMVTNSDKIDELEEEIKSMPHYECQIESVSKFVNKDETFNFIEENGEWGFMFYNDEGDWYRDGNGWLTEADCEGDVCYVSYEKEVCQIPNPAGGVI